MAVTIQEIMWQGFPTLCIETAQIAMQIIPALGAKVVSLCYRPSKREFLWRQPDRPLRAVVYGSAFDQADISGWDECFPSIAETPYPLAPWQGIPVPDHGELWTLPWQWEVSGTGLRMWMHSVRFGYRFERTFDFDESSVAISYQAANPTAFGLHALWSMHPFFQVTPSSRVVLPPGVGVRVEISTGTRIGPFLSEVPWPVTHDHQAGQPVDLSIMGPPQPTTEKLYSTLLPEGWAALYHPDDEHFVAFTFDPGDVPFVGICQIRGGWPPQGEPAYTVLLEPCTGWPDRLDLAVAHGTAMVIPAGQARRWHVKLHLGRTRACLEACLGRVLDGILVGPEHIADEI